MGIVETLVGAIVLGLALAVILYLIGNYVNVTLYKNFYVNHGKRIALLNAIGGSADFVLKDSLGQPQKIILDKSKLENSAEELDGFYYYDYDYKLEIKEKEHLETIQTWKIGFDDLEYFSNFEEKCAGIGKGANIETSSLPVVIFDGEKYNHGIMSITTTKTPLSNIASVFSITCSDLVDVETNRSGYIYSIDGIEIENLENNLKRICIVYEKNSKEERMCKKIICDSEIKKIENCKFPAASCNEIKGTLCEKVYEDLCGCYKFAIQDCLKKRYCNQVVFNKLKNNEIEVWLPEGVFLNVK